MSVLEAWVCDDSGIPLNLVTESDTVVTAEDNSTVETFSNETDINVLLVGNNVMGGNGGVGGGVGGGGGGGGSGGVGGNSRASMAAAAGAAAGSSGSSTFASKFRDKEAKWGTIGAALFVVACAIVVAMLAVRRHRQHQRMRESGHTLEHSDSESNIFKGRTDARNKKTRKRSFHDVIRSRSKQKNRKKYLTRPPPAEENQPIKFIVTDADAAHQHRHHHGRTSSSHESTKRVNFEASAQKAGGAQQKQSRKEISPTNSSYMSAGSSQSDSSEDTSDESETSGQASATTTENVDTSTATRDVSTAKKESFEDVIVRGLDSYDDVLASKLTSFEDTIAEGICSYDDVTVPTINNYSKGKHNYYQCHQSNDNLKAKQSGCLVLDISISIIVLNLVKMWSFSGHWKTSKHRTKRGVCLRLPAAPSKRSHYAHTPTAFTQKRHAH